MPASKFVWYELMTADAAAAEKFYDAVVGWTSRDAGFGPGMAYTLFSAAGSDVAGSMAFPPGVAEAGVPPNWTGYIGVESVDATAAKVVEHGGKLMRPPGDIPNVGRFAICADPQGAVFALFQGNGEAPPAPAPGTAGTFGWHELSTHGWNEAFTFYETLFGWAKDTPVDMGPAGTYQIFSIDGVPCGGMMDKPEGVPGGPAWLYYVNVDGIDAAVERITAGGGKVVNGPMEVPGGSWIVNAVDPLGAMFALVSTTK